MEKVLSIDTLTQIGNLYYFQSNYNNYLTKHPNSNLIMIDIEKFKYINDNYGHEIGNLYLKTLANVLNSTFDNSLVSRIHGDEFLILTEYSEEEINKLFLLIEKKIKLLTLEERIPTIFRINAGSCPCDKNKDIDYLKKQADCMMYFAKKNGVFYQPFKAKIWKEKEKEDNFISSFDKSIKEKKINYKKRQLFQIDATPKNIYQIYTSSFNKKTLLGTDNYELLRKNNRLFKLDSYNINLLINNFDENINIISIDYSSLIKDNGILEYLKELSDINKDITNKFIINIKLYPDNSKSDLEVLIKKCELLSMYGFKIMLDSFNNFTIDAVWQYIDVNYIGFCSDYMKTAMNVIEDDYYFRKKIDFIVNYPNKFIIPVFSKINSEEEYKYLNSFCPANSLATGEYYNALSRKR